MILHKTTKIILPIFLFLIVPQFSAGQSGWYFQNSGTSVNLKSIKFINDLTGYSIGDNGTVIRTTNGGNNWVLQQINTDKDLLDLAMQTSNNIYIAGDSGTVFKSTNGGLDWVENKMFGWRGRSSIFFVNDSIGYCGGYFCNYIYRTINGGKNWDSISLNDNEVYSIHFVNSLTGWINVINSAVSINTVFRTTNGGLNWVAQFSGNFFPVFFNDSNNGWVTEIPQFLNNIQKLHRTTNGGNNWFTTTFHPQTDPILGNVFFTNSTNGFSFYSGFINNSLNGGANWEFQSLVSSADFNSIFMIDSLKGWIVGTNGTILSTNTGGITTIKNTHFENPDTYYLKQNFPNPFNPITTIDYEISNPAFVTIKISDMLGKEIILINENKTRGTYHISFDGSNFPSGIYYYSLIVNDQILDVKKMVLLK